MSNQSTDRNSYEADHSAFEYRRNYKHIGKCLIINNEHFSGWPDGRRRGTEVDERILCYTFKSLGFTVQVENDLSADDMVSVLDKVSKEDHAEMRCFVCVLLSHGQPGVVLGADRQATLVRSLTSALTSEHCPCLRGKPKLFFVQACRGTEFDLGVETDSEESQEEFVGVSEIPEEDFLCCHSTTPGYFSWRNPALGSIFIKELCEVLTLHSGMEITQLLTRVNHQVAMFFQASTSEQEARDGKRQMPCILSRLTKVFYLS